MGDWDKQRDIEQEGQRAALAYDRPHHYRTDAGEIGLQWHPTPRDLITQKVAEAIADDLDGKIRLSLIDLGWTPPEGSR